MGNSANDGRFLPPNLRWMVMAPKRVPFAEAFAQLQIESRRHPDCYNQPDRIPPNQPLLYELASRANIINVVREIARSWGNEDSDGPLKGFDKLRSWPDAESPGPHALRLSYGMKVHDNLIVHLLAGSTSDQVQVHDHNGRLVLSDNPEIIRPGDWMSDLMLEYMRFRIWRQDNEDTPGSTPKPAETIPLHHSIKPRVA